MNHLPDETLSALVDHEVVPGVDVAHVDECVTCRTRLDSLRRVATAVAEPVALPAAHVREAAVASALVETTGAAGAVRRLTTARRARAKAAAGSARRVNAASAVAALLVALGVGGWLLSQVGGNSDPHATTAGVLGTTRLAVSTTSVAPTFYDAGNIGEFSQMAAVIARFHDDSTSAHPSTRSEAGDTTAPCPIPPDRAVVWHASLTYNGVAADARVLTASPSDRILEIRAQADCALVASQAI